MKAPDGYNGYEGGAPYWILPSGRKTYDYAEFERIDKEYWEAKAKAKEKNDRQQH